MRAATRVVGTQFLEIFNRLARHDLVVRVHHGFHHYRVTRINGEHRCLRVVKPAPLCGLQRGGQQVHFAGQFGRSGERLRNSQTSGDAGNRDGETYYSGR